MSNIPVLTIEELSERYQSKEISPVEVVEVMFDHIDKVNPAINAIYYTDKQSAKKAAKGSEERWSKGEPLGKLDGIPTTVKDALPTIGPG